LPTNDSSRSAKAVPNRPGPPPEAW
jgi:hypothetical protein